MCVADPQSEEPRQTTLPEEAACLKCGYSLRGLAENRCPECGMRFDPRDPRTYRIGKALPWWLRPSRGPGIIHIPLAICVAGVWLYYNSDGRHLFGLPRSLLIVMLLSPWICAALVGHYTLCLVAARIRHYREIPATEGHLRHRLWRWVASPVCVFLVLLAFTTDIPLRLRFAASRGSFEAIAKDVLAGTPVQVPRRAGLYRVQAIERTGDDLYFITGNDIDPYGFRYFWPAKPDPDAGGRLSVTPRWHRWSS